MNIVEQFEPKIVILTAVKYCSILHGHVCVMHLGYVRSKLYVKMPMQYTAIFYDCTNDNFHI